MLPAIINAEQRSRREKKSLVAVYWFIDQKVATMIDFDLANSRGRFFP